MGPFVLAAAIPLLFLHRNYQPGFAVGSADVELSDLAVLAVLVAAVLSRPRLRARDWGAWLAFAVLVLVGVAWGAARFDAYPVGTHLTTAAKWIEYMLLAPAVVAIARRPRDLLPAAVTLVAWDVVAGVVALLQFVGVVDDLDHTPAGRRKPSFVGVHDYAALSGGALVVALVVLVRGARSPRERGFAVTAGVAGGVGMVIGGAFDSLLGLVLAGAGLVVATGLRDPRRLVAVGAILAVVAAGIVAIRSSAVADGLKFLGAKQGSGGASTQIQSYRQRALLAYVGGREFLGHPVLGVGWQGSADPYAFEPYLADARRRFVQPPQAFPSQAHRWGVQNAYVQSLADLGVLGLLTFLAALLVPAGRAWRSGRGDVRAAGVALPLLVLGAWNGYGLVAGIPLAALTWLGTGVAVAAVSLARVPA
ncbi:MAG TPA: O-antigen ligase family protein [Gaiellaceae bacterium]|nr:O-antigen ligase family protein [Gaiellaceae bacterium]